MSLVGLHAWYWHDWCSYDSCEWWVHIHRWCCGKGGNLRRLQGDPADHLSTSIWCDIFWVPTNSDLFVDVSLLLGQHSSQCVQCKVSEYSPNDLLGLGYMQRTESATAARFFFNVCCCCHLQPHGWLFLVKTVSVFKMAAQLGMLFWWCCLLQQKLWFVWCFRRSKTY